MFSPYYAFARRKGPADPLNHCAINVAVYRSGGNRWAMTERARDAVSRTTDTFTAGPSHLSWNGSSLTIDVNEITVPIPGRLRGNIRLVPTAITQQAFSLNPSGNHQWWPIAPCARVQVRLDHPRLSWQGDGYFDMNQGDAPLEQGFSDWQWSRGAMRESTAILYEALRRDGSRVDLAMTFDLTGRMQAFEPPPTVEVRRTGWRVARSVRSESTARIVKTARGRAVLCPLGDLGEAARRARYLDARKPLARPLQDPDRAGHVAVPHAAGTAVDLVRSR
ncbi:hydratase [Bradyrhizobium betae]|uniref:hydratase n=1 Tax=Bradyrhizobium betae TaxID=244734 RepID=UPI003D67F695